MYSSSAQPGPIVIAEHRQPRFGRHAMASAFCLMFLFGLTQAANSGSLLQRDRTAMAMVQPVQGAEVRSLEVGQPIPRELKGGQSHSYEISIAAGQYSYVVVDQKGIDVVVKLFAPDGKLITEVDSPNGTLGPEPVYVIAETTGVYRLHLQNTLSVIKKALLLLLRACVGVGFRVEIASNL